MIQRIQTVYLLLAVIVSGIVLPLQIGLYEPSTMGVGHRLFNFYVFEASGEFSFRVLPLALLLMTEILTSAVAIFLYRKRPVQIRLCNAGIILLLLYYVAYALYGWFFGYTDHTFQPEWSAGLPVVAVITIFLARRGIKADERLVKAADRIR